MNILVTGGASGLGASIVQALAKDNGDVVYFTYAKSVAAAEKMEKAYPAAKAILCDFTNQNTVDGLIAHLADIQIDVLVNNAWGGMHKEHFHKIAPQVFLDSFKQNILPTLQITQEAIKVFRKKKSGKIINIISSAVINKPPIGWAEYTAGKSYLLAMSAAWATEGIKFGITSNCVSPSFMLTNLTADTDERIIEQMNEEHPLKRLLTADEVAEAVVFLTRATQQINGINMVINAGTDIAG